jgi:quercetin dioxygenase-like cupin family protein
MRLPLLLSAMSTAGLALTLNAFAASPVTVTPVFSSANTIADQPVTLPQGPVVVTSSIFTIEAGASLPVHRHAFPRYGYVLAGTLTINNRETGKIQKFHAGDFIIESVSKWHSGANTGPDQLQLLVIDQAPAGAVTTEVRQ